MAKAVKPKVAKAPKAKPELPKVEKVETLAGDMEVLSTQSVEPAPKIGDEPPSVTLEEVKEVESLVVKEVIPEPKEVPMEIKVETLEAIKNAEPTPIKLTDNSHLDLPMEQKILNFIESRDGEIKMNDFLKSLFGVPKFGEPPVWLSQSASKELRGVLGKLNNEGSINIISNAHMKLGTFYYPDATTGKTEYHNLNTVQIICIK